MADGNGNDILEEADINQSETSHDRWPRVFGWKGHVRYVQDGRTVDGAVEFPTEWNPVVSQAASAVPIPPESEEAHRVLRLFYNRPGEDWRYKMVATRVFRIENPALWARYYSQRERMKKVNEDHIKETMLFHATSHENINSICRRGFETGQKTKGIYFSPDSRMSHHFSTCINKASRPRIVRKPSIFTALSATFRDLGRPLPESHIARERSTVEDEVGNTQERNVRYSNSLRAMEKGDALSENSAYADQEETTALNDETEKHRVLQLAGRATAPGIEAVVPIPEMDEVEAVELFPVGSELLRSWGCVHYMFASSVLLGNTTPAHLFDHTKHDSAYDRRPQYLEFIIPKNFQAYPEYLIEYSENIILCSKPCHYYTCIVFASLFCLVSCVLIYLSVMVANKHDCFYS